MLWKDDRNSLREALREGMRKKTLNGLEGTFLCALVSHMRGKIHMRSFSGKKGGWRAGRGVTKGPAPAAYGKRYGEYAQLYYEGSAIETLEDQAAWIQRFSREVDFEFGSLQPLAELVERVLHKKWDAPVAQ